MTKPCLLVIVIICFLLEQSRGEVADSVQVREKALGINMGYYNMGSIDELYSYANYSGANWAYGFKLMDKKKRYQHQLSMRAALINRTPKTIYLSKSYFDENSSIIEKNSFLFESFDTYRFHLPRISPAFFNVYATGTWLTSVNITTNEYGLPELIQSGINAGLYADKTYKKIKAYAGFSIPLFMWTVRNSYSLSLTQTYEKLNEFTFIKQNSQFQFPNTLRAIYSNAGCIVQLAKHWQCEAEYEFRYMLNTSPRPLRSVAGIYSFGLIYKF